MSERERFIERGRKGLERRLASEKAPGVLPNGQLRSEYIREKSQKAAEAMDRAKKE